MTGYELKVGDMPRKRHREMTSKKLVCTVGSLNISQLKSEPNECQEETIQPIILCDDDLDII